MLNILTGLPKNKINDSFICKQFADAPGKKAICGSSTMKMYCRELNIEAEINLSSGKHPEPRYKIKNIDLASEGVITLNKCREILSGNKTDYAPALGLAGLLESEAEINFIVGTADNGEFELYNENELLPRIKIIKKIISLLESKNKKVTLKLI